MTSMMRSTALDAVFSRKPGVEHDRLAEFRVHLSQNHAQSLTTLIESEIIPRLVVAHSSGAALAAARPQIADPAVVPDDIEMLVTFSLQVEADTLIGHVESVLARGVPVDTVLVDLLAPAARRLGEYWEDDRCDFVEVTMALWRLQEVVHELDARVPADRALTSRGHRALFASMPGDQHSFGTVVIDEMFRRAGWHTDRLSEVETPDLLHRVANEWFEMVGLTVSCDCNIATLGSVIAALRNVSRNPRLCVMVGGRVFGVDPGLAEKVGADGTAPDAKLALKLADRLVQARNREVTACS